MQVRTDVTHSVLWEFIVGNTDKTYGSQTQCGHPSVLSVAITVFPGPVKWLSEAQLASDLHVVTEPVRIDLSLHVQQTVNDPKRILIDLFVQYLLPRLKRRPIKCSWDH